MTNLHSSPPGVRSGVHDKFTVLSLSENDCHVPTRYRSYSTHFIYLHDWVICCRSSRTTHSPVVITLCIEHVNRKPPFRGHKPPH